VDPVLLGDRPDAEDADPDGRAFTDLHRAFLGSTGIDCPRCAFGATTRSTPARSVALITPASSETGTGKSREKLP
jgi:hypothetical protein